MLEKRGLITGGILALVAGGLVLRICSAADDNWFDVADKAALTLNDLTLTGASHSAPWWRRRAAASSAGAS
jgi:hypothetical protein